MKIKLLFLALILFPVLSYAQHHGSGEPIIEDQKFKAFFEANADDKSISIAKQIAGKVTLDQLEMIKAVGGITYFQGSQGCPNRCLGCLLKADQNIDHQIKRMKWEDFTYAVDGLLQLEKVLKAVEGYSDVTLLNRSDIFTYWDSDPMLHKFPAKDGTNKDLSDMVRYIYEKTGSTSHITTAGWNPTSSTKETVDKLIAFAKENPGKRPFDIVLNVKFHTPEFVRYFEKSMLKLLKSDEEFSVLFEEDLAKHGLDISSYEFKKEAELAYAKIVDDNLDDIIKNSTVYKNRMANIRTLEPLIKGGLAVTVHFYYFKDTPPLLEQDKRFKAIIPLLTYENMDHVRELLGTSNFKIDKWGFDNYGPRSYVYDRKDAVYEETGLMFDGTIRFSTDQDFKIFNLPLSTDPVLQSFSDNAILSPLTGPVWSITANRLNGTQYEDLTESVVSSIKDQVPGISDVEQKAEYVVIDGVTTPVVKVVVDGEESRFDFYKGELYGGTKRLSDSSVFALLSSRTGSFSLDLTEQLELLMTKWADNNGILTALDRTLLFGSGDSKGIYDYVYNQVVNDKVRDVEKVKFFLILAGVVSWHNQRITNPEFGILSVDDICLISKAYTGFGLLDLSVSTVNIETNIQSRDYIKDNPFFLDFFRSGINSYNKSLIKK